MIPDFLASASFVSMPRGEKVPLGKWREVALSAAEVQRHVEAGGNLAIRVGRASGSLVDADLDCREAMELAPLYLPPTGAIFGRASKLYSHRLYRSPGGRPTPRSQTRPIAKCCWSFGPMAATAALICP
jgi:hypothetical protein